MAKVNITVTLSNTPEVIDLVDYGYDESVKWSDLDSLEKDYIATCIKIKSSPKFKFQDIE